MFDPIFQLVGFITTLLKTRMGLQIENLALRHQLCVLQRSVNSRVTTRMQKASLPEYTQRHVAAHD
jgi:hypothetical protein